jgi:hypothetical protein
MNTIYLLPTDPVWFKKEKTLQINIITENYRVIKGREKNEIPKIPIKELVYINVKDEYNILQEAKKKMGTNMLLHCNDCPKNEFIPINYVKYTLKEKIITILKNTAKKYQLQLSKDTDDIIHDIDAFNLKAIEAIVTNNK